MGKQRGEKMPCQLKCSGLFLFKNLVNGLLAMNLNIPSVFITVTPWQPGAFFLVLLYPDEAGYSVWEELNYTTSVEELRLGT